ncbi:DNA utilization protein GntX [Roseivivax jejudonensis]|uniref:DNA utilization protein GntX n=1 Tax=Roseivivax jejudonensis TaxID=1529041 RepID=A0A1X6ZP62_9RHOB|nr:ComF family protein [Roseivivax jejudonensis]SLN57624.1 DNA utilization protein GntX [Roseivivax jejudonensis]
MRGLRLQTAIRLVYPPACLACGGRVESDFGLCGSCWADTSFVAGAVCDACGTPLPGGPDAAESAGLTCDECLKIPRPWARGRAALLYSGAGRKLVLGLKHGDRHDIARPAATWMANAAASLLQADTVIVPVPLHTLRLLRRRYNQSALLCAALGHLTGHTVAVDVLKRVQRTPSLDGQSRDQRFATLAGAIRADPRRVHLVADHPVLLVDDVMTSGATLAAGTEALVAAGATEVCVLALARAARDT